MQSTPTQQDRSGLVTEDTILWVECDEPEGKITRYVRPLIFTPENLKRFWECANKHRTLFGSEIPNVQKFLELFLSYDDSNHAHLNGMFWVIDDFVGVFYITDITVELDAKVHYSFFNGRHHGRAELTRRMLWYLFATYKFRRLTAEIPKFAKYSARHFCELLGFKHEGVRRNAAKYKDGWFGVDLYGLLESELVLDVNQEK